MTSRVAQPLVSLVSRPRRLALMALVFRVVMPDVGSASPASGPPSTAVSVTVFDGTLGDGAQGSEVSTAELVAGLADPSTVVLDARAPEEYAVSHIPGAKNVPGKPGLPPSQYTADVTAVQRLGTSRWSGSRGQRSRRGCAPRSAARPR
jgi:hypothetical protein